MDLDEAAREELRQIRQQAREEVQQYGMDPDALEAYWADPSGSDRSSASGRRLADWLAGRRRWQESARRPPPTPHTFWLKSPERGSPLSSITCRCPCRVMVAPIGSQRLRAEALRLILAAFLFVFIFLSRATLCVAQFIFFFTLAWMFKVMAVFVRALWYCHVGATIDIGL